jgi:hypothetical protein
MSMEFRQATTEQLVDIKNFVDSCAASLDLLKLFKLNFELQMAISKIQESMFWFNSYILNCGEKLPTEDAQPEMTVASNAIN